MSINILKEPQDLSPAYNEVMTIVESTNVAEDKFRYLFEIVDVDAATTVSSSYVSPHFNGAYGIFDAHRFIESYVSENIEQWDNVNIFTHIEESYFNYKIKITESYVNTLSFGGFANSGGFVRLSWLNHNLITGNLVTITNTAKHNGTYTITYIDVTTIDINVAYNGTETGDIVKANNEVTLMTNTTIETSELQIFNGVADWFTSPNFLSDDYKLGLFVQGKLLTENSLDMGTYKRSDYAFVNVWNESDNLSTRLMITTNNGSYYIVNALDTTASGVISVGVGVANLENAALPILVSGSLPMIDDNTTDVSFHLADGSSTRTSEIYTYKVNQECSKFGLTQFMYIDKFGALDSISFDLAKTRNVTINKEHFNKNYGEFDTTTVSWRYNSYDKGKAVLNTSKKEVFKVQSNYMSEVDGAKVLSLIESPNTYINDNGVLKSINITTTSLNEKTKLNDKLISYEITYEYSNINSNQRG